MKRFLILVLLSIMLIFIAACQPNPQKEIVVNKGNDNLTNLIEKDNDELFKVDTATWKEDFKIYESHYAKVPMHVIVDAVVKVPDTDKFPVANIKHRYFNKNDLKNIADIFFNGDIKLGASDYMTPEEITETILDIKQTINKLRNNPELDSEGTIANLEFKIKDYENRLSNSKGFSELSNIDWDKIDDDPGYISLVSLDKGKSSKIIINNSEDSGKSQMAYCQSKYDYFLDISNSLHISNSLKSYQPFSESLPKGIKIGLNQAKELADNVAAKLDKDMRYYGYSICPKEQIKERLESVVVENECYVLHYTRQIQNVPITYVTNPAEYSGEHGKPWDYEFMSFFIDDTGIIAFVWDNPKQVSKIVNDNVAMLPFDIIREYTKQQISIHNAFMDDFSDYYDYTTFKIDRIELGMTIVKKKDTNDEYMAIPVWDFFGNFSWTYSDKAIEEWKEPNKTYKTITWPGLSELTINAIDGSVIDRSLGY